MRKCNTIRTICIVSVNSANDASGSAVGIIKQNTSRELKIKFPFLKEVYRGAETIWSAGYFVSTIGINEEVIKRYIEYQGKNDAGQGVLNL